MNIGSVMPRRYRKIRLSDFFIDDCLNSIAVGVENKCGVIVTAIFRMQSRSAIIFPAVLKCSPVKCCHSFLRRRGKGNMETFARRNHSLSSKLDGELVAATGHAVTHGRLVCSHTNVAQRRKCRIVKLGRASKIGDGKREVMQHVCGEV